jgi:hypothetical protein
VTEKNLEETMRNSEEELAVDVDVPEARASVTEASKTDVTSAAFTVAEAAVTEDSAASVPSNETPHSEPTTITALQQEASASPTEGISPEVLEYGAHGVESSSSETSTTGNRTEYFPEPTAEIESPEANEKNAILEGPVANGSSQKEAPLASPRAARIRDRTPSRRTTLREQRRRRATTRKSRKRTIYGILGGLVAATLILGLALPSFAGLITPAGTSVNDSTENIPNVGTYIPVQPSSVLEDGESYGAYSSPPTSGPSYARGVEWGAYTEEQANESIVRNLEQGAIVVNYNFDNESQTADLISYLEAQSGYPGCFIVQPHAGTAVGYITLTSWGWMETYTGVDRPSMQEFVDDHKNRAPLFEGPTCGTSAALFEPRSLDDSGN